MSIKTSLSGGTVVDLTPYVGVNVGDEVNPNWTVKQCDSVWTSINGLVKKIWPQSDWTMIYENTSSGNFSFTTPSTTAPIRIEYAGAQGGKCAQSDGGGQYTYGTGGQGATCRQFFFAPSTTISGIIGATPANSYSSARTGGSGYNNGSNGSSRGVTVGTVASGGGGGSTGFSIDSIVYQASGGSGATWNILAGLEPPLIGGKGGGPNGPVGPNTDGQGTNSTGNPGQVGNNSGNGWIRVYIYTGSPIVGKSDGYGTISYTATDSIPLFVKYSGAGGSSGSGAVFYPSNTRTEISGNGELKCNIFTSVVVGDVISSTVGEIGNTDPSKIAGSMAKYGGGRGYSTAADASYSHSSIIYSAAGAGGGSTSCVYNGNLVGEASAGGGNSTLCSNGTGGTSGAGPLGGSVGNNAGGTYSGSKGYKVSVNPYNIIQNAEHGYFLIYKLTI